MFSVVLASSLALNHIFNVLCPCVFTDIERNVLCSHPWFHEDQWIQGMVLWVGGQKKASGIQDLVDELILIMHQ